MVVIRMLPPTYVRKCDENAFSEIRELEIAFGRRQNERARGGVENGGPCDRQRRQ